MRFSAHPILLRAKEASADSGGGRQDKAPSPASAGEGVGSFQPIDDQAPKFGELVRVSIGGQSVEAIRDPFGWYTAGHQARLEGVPDGWQPL